jgi:23S rRNA G2445 N2-methylase RlmL
VKIERSSPWSLSGTLAVEAKLLNPVSPGTNRGED